MIGTLCVNGRLGTDIYPLSSDGEGEVGNGLRRRISGLRHRKAYVGRKRAWRDSNPRPQPPQGCALSKLSYKRSILSLLAMAAIALQVRQVRMRGSPRRHIFRSPRHVIISPLVAEIQKDVQRYTPTYRLALAILWESHYRSSCGSNPP